MSEKSDDHSVVNLRSRWFFAAGHTFSFFVAMCFVVAVGIIAISSEYWQKWLYSGSYDLSNSCDLSMRSAGGEETAWGDPINVTLPNRFLPPPSPGILERAPKYQLRFQCELPVFLETSLAYVHWGWIAGDSIRVRVNDKQFVSYSGLQKLVTPVSGGERVEIIITHPTEKMNMAGFIGSQKPSLALGSAMNDKFFGIDMLLSITKNVGYLFPILSLGVILSLAWFSGFRGRPLTIAVYVMVWAVLVRSSVMWSFVTDFFKAEVTYLSFFFRLGFGISVVLFHMEVARVLPKAIYPLARTTTLMLIAGATAMILTSTWSMLSTLYYVSSALLGTTSMAIAAAIALRVDEKNRLIMYMSTIAGLCYFTDAYLRLSGGNTYSLNNILQIVLPIYVAIYLLIHMSVSEKKLWKARNHNLQLSNQIMVESTRAETLSRFLPKALVTHFTRHDSIDSSLRRVLTPREERIAVIQADLRGFSKLVANSESRETIKILQMCFGSVVDYAQKYGMVKLVGDCLFAFIEPIETARTPVDIALEIAARIIRQVDEVNGELNLDSPLRFGIAVTYGDAVVGNLSSEHCIDYTAIGSPVNLVARLEELTKNPVIANIIGNNGVILSKEAVAGMTHSEIASANVIETSLVKVRSFEQIKQLHYLTAEQCLNVVGDFIHHSAESRDISRIAAA